MDNLTANKLTCHCGAIEIELSGELGTPYRCNCSMCRRKGAVMAAIPKDNLNLIKGNENLSCYQFRTHTAEHYFCNICGIYTHHSRYIDSSSYGVNVACLHGNPIDNSDITTINGKDL